MNVTKCTVWSGVFFLLVFPWLVATALSWIYSEAYSNTAEDSGGGATNASRIIAIIQTSSGLVYLLYILLAVLWIGCQGRASLCSFCCMAMGIPIFLAVPVAGGITLLIEALNNRDNIGRDVGLVAAVCCFVSSAMCIVITMVALICGSKGKGHNHRFPIPLAYFPILEEFEDFRKTEINDVDRHTKDYPPPLSNFRERKISNTGSVGTTSVGNGRRLSILSQKSSASNPRLDTKKNGGLLRTPEHRVSTSRLSASGRLSSSSSSLYSRSDQKPSSTHQPGRKTSIVSTASSSRGRDRKLSATSNVSVVFSKDNKSSEQITKNYSRNLAPK